MRNTTTAEMSPLQLFRKSRCPERLVPGDARSGARIDLLSSEGVPTTRRRKEELGDGGDDMSGYVDMYAVSAKRALQSAEELRDNRHEVHSVVLLTDVFGWEDARMRSVADELSFLHNCVVLVPDLFNGRPWREDGADGEDYETWRAAQCDPERTMTIIVRAAEVARKNWNAASVGLMGFCYGGGRALEAASAAIPPKVDLAVAFYPTRYDPPAVAASMKLPVMALFAGEDTLSGATPQDAQALKNGLDSNANCPDFLVRIYSGEKHGFAHRADPQDGGRAVGVGGVEERVASERGEDAMLLATSWLGVYLRKKHKLYAPRAKSQEAPLWV